MSANHHELIPTHQADASPVVSSVAQGAAQWGPPNSSVGDEQEPRAPWGRYVAALNRYKWLILAIILVGAAVGWTASGLVRPVYQAEGKIIIMGSGGLPMGGGPVRSAPLVAPQHWQTIFVDPIVVDSVVARLALYVRPESTADSVVFKGFQVTSRLVPGRYRLDIDSTRALYTLRTARPDSVLEQGSPGDSIGRSLGFGWAPEKSVLQPTRSYRFQVLRPRAATNALIGQYQPSAVAADASFLTVRLQGTDPVQAARQLNVWMNEFLRYTRLKKNASLSDFVTTLEQQRDDVQRMRDSAKAALEQFKTKTATEPKEVTALIPGVAAGPDPLLAGFHATRQRRDAMQRDIEAAERLLGMSPDLASVGIGSDSISLPDLLAIPSFAALPRSDELKDRYRTIRQLETSTAKDRARFTPEYPQLRDSLAYLAHLRDEVRPIAAMIVQQLRGQRAALDTSIVAQQSELEQIPARSTIEMTLRQRLDAAQRLYDRLDQSYTDARLAEKGSSPDVQVMSEVLPPVAPISNTRPKLMAMALIASVGLGVILAILLDRLDKRFRYPEQVTEELGFTVLGAIPKLRNSKRRTPDLDEESQVVEAYRSIRLAVRSSFNGDGKVALTVSSAGPGDGKSMVSSNLALSFAEAGFRTLIIDGDTRRGTLHDTFNVAQKPGLLDYLARKAPIEAVLRQTEQHENLTLMPCGMRRRHGPELISGSGMAPLMAEMRKRYDVIIVDSPPLGAGIDPFALAALTGNILVVFRSGKTDLGLMRAKLEILRRLRVRELGAVLNGFKAASVYRYYSYLPGYYASEDEQPEVSESLALTAPGQLERPDALE
jgi:capsular exopolysaccharide synthesis family protein